MATVPLHELRDDPAALVSADEARQDVRDEIVASWRR
ncbi:MAG: hypothetical protein JWN62_1067, partial [Acidimicrobiales bacterium]|nr:hypothetical protein [Acidimicrobiales bacterium]